MKAVIYTADDEISALLALELEDCGFDVLTVESDAEYEKEKAGAVLTVLDLDCAEAPKNPEGRVVSFSRKAGHAVGRFLARPFDMSEFLSACTDFSEQKEKINIRLIPSKCTAVINGAEYRLSLKEFELFSLLYAENGRAVDKDAIRQRLWTSDNAAENAVNLYIHYLRRRLGEYGSIIAVKRGGGYYIKLN